MLQYNFLLSRENYTELERAASEDSFLPIGNIQTRARHAAEIPTCLAHAVPCGF